MYLSLLSILVLFLFFIMIFFIQTSQIQNPFLDTVTSAQYRFRKKSIQSSYCRKHGPFFLKVICIDLYRNSFYCCIDWCDTYPYISRVFCAKVFEKYWTYTHSHTALTWMRIIIIITENSHFLLRLHPWHHTVNIKTNERDLCGRDGTVCL